LYLLKMGEISVVFAPITINREQDGFILENESFFYMADTVWSALTSLSMSEWENYLEYRRRQGFNALQINVLPQWDASGYVETCKPFAQTLEGNHDYLKPNEVYFQNARERIALARAYGFVPVLVLLWANYIPKTWASGMGSVGAIPREAVAPYVEYAVKLFSEFQPIYMVSGDTDFVGETAAAYYTDALETVKKNAPEALTTMHISGEHSSLPESIENNPLLDFYVYQSCHNGGGQHHAYHLAEAFLKKKPRPIVNAEPCYEAHGQGSSYGRHHAFEVRRAAWQSVLSGAKAGITYGAHGIWSVHRLDATFPNPGFANTPLDFQDALRLPGAWDMSYLKWLFGQYHLAELSPAKLTLNATEEIRASKSRDGSRFAVYTPYAAEIGFNLDLSGYEVVEIDLENRRVMTPKIYPGKGESVSRLLPSPSNSDSLILGTKRQ
jgi:hypothetical protein